MTRFGAWRDPAVARIVDLVMALLCMAAMGVELARLDQATPSALAAAAVVAAALPVLLRRRAPAWALVLAMVTLVGVLLTARVYNTVGIPAVLCAYSLASIRGRRTALWAAAAVLPAVMVLLQVRSPHNLFDWDTARNLALIALPLALGVAAHDRRSYTAALVERAETAERTREEEARRRVDEERLRMARDVHDVVAHAMVAINVQAGVGAHLLDRDPQHARQTLDDIKRVSGDALVDLRAVLSILRTDDNDRGARVDSPVRPVQGLAEIDGLREGLGSAGVRLDVDIASSTTPLPAAVGATGYRIVQEALTNVMRHVGPTSARVRVTRRDGVVVIEVEDDGGVPAPSGLVGSGSGHGLRGMRERAAAVGGSLEAGPRAEGGWRVAAVLPVAAP